MTVSYTGDVANASSFGCFSTILCRWRGSIYKLIYKELLAYIMAYFIINLTYRVVLVPKSECDMTLPSCQRWKSYRELFEALRLYCHENLKTVPLTFMLGFYVSLIVTMMETVQPTSMARLIWDVSDWIVQPGEW